MATTSRRPIDVQQQEFSDEATSPTIRNGINGVSAHRRGGSDGRSRATDNYTDLPEDVPAAPDVPRGPPISYRGPSSRDDSVPQRSFSQRAKARPLAREVFGDEGAISQYDNGNSRPSVGKPQKIYEDALAPTANRNGDVALHLDTSVQRGKSVKQTPTLGGPASDRTQPSTYPTTAQLRDERRASDAAPRIVQAIPPPQRSSTLNHLTHLTDEQRREWAPDRSPLQKLEVTLNDISKEEKRARVEEAEMLLRESKAGRGGRRASREVAPAQAKAPMRQVLAKITPEPASLEEAGLVRSLSSTHRDRLSHSATVESKKPDVKRLSGEGRRGFDYQEQDYPEAEAHPEATLAPSSPRQSQSRRREENLPTRPSQSQRSQRIRDVADDPGFEPEEHHPMPQPRQRPVENNVRSPNAKQREWTEPRIASTSRSHQYSQIPRPIKSYNRYSQDQNNIHRSVSAQQTANEPNVARAVPTNITRAVSLQNQQPYATFADEEDDLPRAGPAREANSSHKAALTGLVAAGTAAAVAGPIARNNSRKLQKAPPRDYAGMNDLQQDRQPLTANAQRNAAEWPQRSPLMAPAAVVKASPRVEPTSNRIPEQESVRRDGPQRAQEPVGLGLHESPPVKNSNSQTRVSDGFSPKPRQQSVSFVEPLSKTGSINEWREAEIARLTATDFDLKSVSSRGKDQAWWENQEAAGAKRGSKRSVGAKVIPVSHADPIDDRHAVFKPPLYLKCGPLLRYTGMKQTTSAQPGQQVANSNDPEIWRGSVLIVTQDSHSSYEPAPTLRLFAQPKDLLPPPPEEVEELAPEYVDPIAGLTKLSRTGKVLYVRPVDHLEEGKDLSMIDDDNGLFETSPSPLDMNGSAQANTATSNDRTRGKDGESVGKYREIKGARLYVDPVRDVTFWRFNLEVELGEHQRHIAYRINRGPAVGFWVPARGQSMHIMFHSCNGFSMSVNPDLFSGPDPLWRDVLNTHQTRPFHVMIGGGDQVYNDRVMVETRHFAHWTQLGNPQEKHNMPFTPEMKEELEWFYLNRYSMWFSQGLFSMANSQIPMINMWNDHDIIDGFGSYPSHFMKSSVFAGLGNIAFKYYMLFQHHCVPEETAADEPSWVLGAAPGPYIHHRSRSLFMHLGKQVAFLGLDCRMERQRDQIMTPDSYENVLERCRRDIIEGETKHLILLLGVPIAYPRLVWLESVLTSRAMDPIKALGRAGIFKGGFLNKFDGGVEILDDLDDHWTAKNHKHERNDLILDLQDLSAEKSVRITILGGDVHLAAIGQFYSNPKLRVPKDRDHRYMPNVISSAIVNTPPPEMMGDILNKRNKVHHLNHYTDEDMIPMFTHDVDGKRRNNKRLLPRRNWCSIREYQPGTTPPPTPPDTPSVSGDEVDADVPRRRFSFSRDARPSNLLRRISGRTAPPSSYRDDMTYSNNSMQRPASMDGATPGYQNQQSANSTPQQRPASFDQQRPSLPVRPGNFQRRPTNLSEKAARKGVVPGLDKDGNEVEVNDYINLEGGLDIILNCEVNQRDPAGITTPYRLLVPALWYDGSSDREKLDGPFAEVMHRKPTLMSKMGLTRRRRRNMEDYEDYDEVSEEGDHSEGEEDEQDEERQPKGLMRLFSGRRRRNYDHDNRDHPPDQLGHHHQQPRHRDQHMHEDYANASHQAQHAMQGQHGNYQQQQYNGSPALAHQAASPQTEGNNSHQGPPPPPKLQQPQLPQQSPRFDLPSPSQNLRPQPQPRAQAQTQYSPQSPQQAQIQYHYPPPPPRGGTRAPLSAGSKAARLLGTDYPLPVPPQGQQQQQQQQHFTTAPASVPDPVTARRFDEAPVAAPGQRSGWESQPGLGSQQYAPTPPQQQGQRPGFGPVAGADEIAGYSGVEAYREPKRRRWSFGLGGGEDGAGESEFKERRRRRWMGDRN